MTELPYHLALNGQSAGPFTLAQVQEMRKAGQVTAQTLYWQEGQANWQPLGQIAGASGEGPPPLSQPPAMPPGAGMMPIIAGPPTSGLAIASLVLGLSSLFFFVTCLPAVICGHLALSQIKQSAGRIGGRGMAIAGLIIGYCYIAFVAVIVVFFFMAGLALPIFNTLNQRGQAEVELANGKQVALAIIAYEADHDGKMPPDFAVLSPTYLTDQTVLHSSLAPLDPSPAFDYLTPNAKADQLPPRTVMLRGRHTTRHRERAYVYVDATGDLKRDP